MSDQRTLSSNRRNQKEKTGGEETEVYVPDVNVGHVDLDIVHDTLHQLIHESFLRWIFCNVNQTNKYEIDRSIRRSTT